MDASKHLGLSSFYMIKYFEYLVVFHSFLLKFLTDIMLLVIYPLGFIRVMQSYLITLSQRGHMS